MTTTVDFNTTRPAEAGQRRMIMTKWQIIEYIPNKTSDVLEWFDSELEARKAMQEIINSKTDDYYDNLVALGGSLMVQDEDGNG
jgi:hypothetical protein